jgi:hypothetical protein
MPGWRGLETASETSEATAFAGTFDPFRDCPQIPGHVGDAPPCELQSAIANPVLACLLRQDHLGRGHTAGSVGIELIQLPAGTVGLGHDPALNRGRPFGGGTGQPGRTPTWA